MSRTDFIEALVDDLVPVRPAISIGRALCSLSSIAWIFVGMAIAASGPLREGAIASLATLPWYSLEFALATLSSFTAMLAGLEFGVPGHSRKVLLLAPPVAFFSAWLGVLAYGLDNPALESGTLGARPLCDVQTLVFALPPLALALYAVKRRALFASTTTGLLMGLGATAVPAAWMQLACLYDSMHTLVHHLGPVLIVGVLSAVGSGWLLRSNATAPGDVCPRLFQAPRPNSARQSGPV
jgi:hypothetical protein